MPIRRRLRRKTQSGRFINWIAARSATSNTRFDRSIQLSKHSFDRRETKARQFDSDLNRDHVASFSGLPLSGAAPGIPIGSW